MCKVLAFILQGMLLAGIGSAVAATQQDFSDCQQTGDIDRSIAACTRVATDQSLSTADRALAWRWLGNDHTAMNAPDVAVGDYGEAIKLDPSNAAMYASRALVYLRKGDRERAVADYRQAVAIDPAKIGGMVAASAELKEIADASAREPTPVAPRAEHPTAAGADLLRLDLVTDCDRLAADEYDPQHPPTVAGEAYAKIDLSAAEPACNAAMGQYPDVARFAYQAGRVALRKQDYVLARQLYEKAASLGSAAATNSVGNLYVAGRGVPTDYALARKYYEKSASMGYKRANVSIAQLYENGWGVPKDLTEAGKWWSKAGLSRN
jgi:TPR repeat protein